jgi:predicted MPP superfamily phosphohydrolase
MNRVGKRIAAVVAIVMMLFVFYSAVVEPRGLLDVDRRTANLPRLGDDWAGAKVAVISDLQLGMWLANTGMMRRAVRTIVADNPDYVFMAGDFIYGEGDPEADVAAALDVLDPLLSSGIPCYAVLGNHDYESGGAQALTQALQQAGVTVLANRAVKLPPPPGVEAQEANTQEGLYLVGIGPMRPGLADVDAALSDLPQDAARIVLMHNPLTFLRLPANSAPLAVAGHTHCGQLAVPFSQHWSWLGVVAEEKIVADDWAARGYGKAGNRLYVTCGLGFSVVPMRFNAVPQVTFFELRR